MGLLRAHTPRRPGGGEDAAVKPPLGTPLKGSGRCSGMKPMYQNKHEIAKLIGKMKTTSAVRAMQMVKQFRHNRSQPQPQSQQGANASHQVGGGDFSSLNKSSSSLSDVRAFPLSHFSSFVYFDHFCVFV
jgi:hypothetical protein